MKNLMIKALMPLALVMLSQFALADIYIGAGMNVTALGVDVDTPEDSDTTPSIFLGWKPISFVALELGYYDLGSYEVDDSFAGKGSFDAEAMTLAAVGILPAFIFDFYGKVGYADTSISSSDFEDLSEDSGAFYALGANVNITSLVDIYLELQRISPNDDIDIDMVGAGVRLVF